MKNKRIVLGVTGGIAVYKACDLTSKLVQEGANVRVVMSENAAKFVSPLTFQALSRNPVYIDTFEERHPEKIAHIDLADWAELAIIAPATANILGKLAAGIADDMLSTTLLATRASIYVAPAMNVHMYAHQQVMENMKKLATWGYHFIEPGAGYLACGYVGKGRLEEPLSIIKAIKNHLGQSTLLAGKKVLVSAGPTREIIDPVRYFTNHSTGKMGFAIAQAAEMFGAAVTLVTGNEAVPATLNTVNQVYVTSAEDMYRAMHDHYDQADIVIMAAAVADYRPKQTFDEKLKKQPGDLTIVMERTKDILQSLGAAKTNQFLVGFAAETTDALYYGEKKLIEKQLDAIVVNNVKEPGAGFGSDTNIVTYLNKQQKQVKLPLASKQQIAQQLFTLIMDDLTGEAR